MRGQENIPRLEVAMHDAAAMGSFKCIYHFRRIAQSQFEWEASLHEALRQRFPFQVLHHQELRCALLANVMNGADVRVLQGRDGSSLSLEPLIMLRTGGKMSGKDLDGNAPI